jgi:hypothetical protein
MTPGNPSQNRGTDGVKEPAAAARHTVAHAGIEERRELLETCKQIGALIIGQRHDRTSAAVDILQKQAAGMLLKQHLNDWLPRFHERVEALEKVVGKGLKLETTNLIQELREKVKAAGFKSFREFVTELVLPVVSYHGVLLFLNNEARVKLPPGVRDEVVQKMNAINKLLGGACAAMVLQESMGI